MATGKLSTKRIQIDKANTTIVIVMSVAAFVIVFSLIASKALLSQMSYQNKVIAAKEKTLTQLEINIDETTKLKKSYDSFVAQPVNILGRSSTGTASGDGDNAKITLNALPSEYDFPALITSLEKLISAQQLSIDGITGTDDEVAQSQQEETTSPEAVPMLFQAKVTGNYDNSRKLLEAFQGSIRPFQITRMSFSGSQTDLSLTLDAQTYYQPKKTFNTVDKEI